MSDSLDPTDGGETRRLIRKLYQQLRAVAQNVMAGERVDHTLTATALTNEVCQRLLEADRQPRWEGERHFANVVAKAMRNILVSHYRAKATKKRGGDRQREPLTDDAAVGYPRGADLLDLDEALKELERHDPDLAEIVNLHHFAALTIEQAAALLDISLHEAKQRWAKARRWLYQRLAGDAE